ncbi:hypothetical protein [Thermostaphylospora chromogena]|uniref:Dolichyl-phosphate-mannose-protein mannosyltransferase n=1 Tax=Thermostaphylospora chromogena TaxID=35622 RepID=A0A1H1EID7_9ACTN|nr:hypothetical protein [Thermostaphylospora chromogena]SDQ88473.1 hypothetical protein SAMN04489764_2493 [Thermostaphylospora chromogena]
MRRARLWRTGPPPWLREAARQTTRHRWFAALLAVGAALRAAAMLGYRPALWFPDTYTYVVTAMRPRPDLVRPAGYSMFLRLLEPLHSFAAVAFVQHLLGLATGALVYLTARRLRAPAWAAALACAPVLLDAYQIELEHLLVSDTLFMFLVTAAVCLALAGGPGPRTAGAIGLLLAAATLTRTVGLPLIAVLAVWLLLRRPSGRGAAECGERESGRRARAVRAGVMLAAAAIPILAYGGWFYATYQRVGIVGANGVFLYARTMAFADCARMAPPPDLAVLCDPRPPHRRPPSQDYIWSADSPLVRLPGITFTREADSLAGRFAVLAVTSQPVDYAGAVLTELARTFTWDRPVYPDADIYGRYEFPSRPQPSPDREPALLGVELARVYEEGDIETRIVEPFAGWMRAYQDVARLPGTLLLAVLLVPLAATAVRRRAPRGGARGPGGRGLAAWALPWTVAWTLLVTPAAVAEFDYRYVLPAVPLACLAAAVSVRGLTPGLGCGRRTPAR